jgi:signal transduction histidine kinase
LNDKNNINLSPLLAKVLKRMNLAPDKLPTDLKDWHSLLAAITNHFRDFDQERYLLERSMELSSKEMRDLYERFEVAQSLALIGYWFYDKTEERIIWSKETYNIFGLNSAESVPAFDIVMEYFHKDDRGDLQTLIDRAINDNKDYETEVRIYHKMNVEDIKWVYVKGHPEKNTDETGKLKISLSGVVMDITLRKEAENNLKQLNQQLINLSRLSGMSEIATSVLHNVGNVLNSVNVSVSFIQDIIKKSEIENLNKLSDLIIQSIKNDPDFFKHNEKGKMIPEYLSDLSKNLLIEYKEINDETINLNKNLEHIRDIVHMQNDVSGISGISEKVNLVEIVDIAIKMSCNISECYGIIIERKFDYNRDIIVNKSKLLQILVNLIRNAKDSLESDVYNTYKTITIQTKKNPDDDSIVISVQDNGVGILAENINKIFSMKYTNKPRGHGFGLHSSALAANELGGCLSVHSEGEGKGALFQLKIPEVQGAFDEKPA